MMLLTATSLPLLVALAAVGLDSGEMLPENAAALVGAGVLSVMVFPGVAVALNRTAPQTRSGPSRTHLPEIDDGVTMAKPGSASSVVNQPMWERTLRAAEAFEPPHDARRDAFIGALLLLDPGRPPGTDTAPGQKTWGCCCARGGS